jgi:hypothetical protein
MSSGWIPETSKSSRLGLKLELAKMLSFHMGPFRNIVKTTQAPFISKKLIRDYRRKAKFVFPERAPFILSGSKKLFYAYINFLQR